MTQTIESTPREDGYWMPGEYAKHAGTWMIWPERPDNWRNGAKPAQKAFAEVAKAIAQFEPVTMCVSTAQFNNARNQLPKNVRVVEMSSNDSWMRDCGPTFVTNGKLTRIVDWDFNAWGGLIGGLYFPWDLDDQVARKVADIECVDRYKAPMVLEGGSIHTDGEGTLITTMECLLNENRNPDMSKDEIEETLKAYLGLEKIIWLNRGIYNDETNGHVDNICCFVKPGVVALAWTEDENDPQYEISQENYEILRNTVDAKGRRLEVHKVLLPKPVLITREESEGVDPIEGTLPRNAGDRLAASYINFYLCNDGLVMPAFGDPNDEIAALQLANLYPGRRVVMVPAREILLGGGNIHCITQQQPTA